MSPVDFAFGKQRDGERIRLRSATLTVVYGMDWTVELILRPKSTVLEEHVTLSNLSDVQAIASIGGTNAGVEVWEDSPD